MAADQEKATPTQSSVSADGLKAARKKPTSKKKKSKKKARTKSAKTQSGSGNLPFPRHTILKSLRIPVAILEQNAGKECSVKDAAKYAGLTYSGEVGVEISSATKYGLLERPNAGAIKPTDLVRRIARPQTPDDKISALREIVLKTPIVSDVYKNYRGENLPDQEFFVNTVVDSFKVPRDKALLFQSVFHEALVEAQLIEKVGEKERVLDVTHSSATDADQSDSHLRKLSKGVSVQATDTCFVMQPFGSPLGGYYASIYEPAIRKAGLTPVRADAEIFGTGKIIEQIWQAIGSAKVLIAELTSRNPNVFYELGLAHALRKPVILVSSNEGDVPFDVRHVRVIYYDTDDPFWGTKLVDKVAEHIISALKDPKDAVLFGV